MRGKTAEGIDVDLAVFRGDHFEERLAHLLDVGRVSFDDHAIVRLRSAGGNGIADAFHFDNAETAAAEGIEPVIIAESGDVFLETLGDLVDRFALGERGLLAIDGDGELRGDDGIGIVDHAGRFLKGRLATGALIENLLGGLVGHLDIFQLKVPDFIGPGLFVGLAFFGGEEALRESVFFAVDSFFKAIQGDRFLDLGRPF